MPGVLGSLVAALGAYSDSAPHNMMVYEGLQNDVAVVT
jgi:hypothetical protein